MTRWFYRFRGYLATPPLIFAFFCFSLETEMHYLIWPIGITLVLIGMILRIWAQQHLRYRLKCVFAGYLEIFGLKLGDFSKNLFCYYPLNQQNVTDTSRTTVRVRLGSGYEGQSAIEIGARLGPRRWFSKSEHIPIILLLFIGVWGTAIILVLGYILYRVAIEPLARKRSKRE